jgi:hypothetical protein
MPLATMVSAISRTRASLIFALNRFQLFHPMGGVRASPLSGSSLNSGSGSLGGGASAASRFFASSGPSLRAVISMGILMPPPAPGGGPTAGGGPAPGGGRNPAGITRFSFNSSPAILPSVTILRSCSPIRITVAKVKFSPSIFPSTMSCAPNSM